MAALHVGIIAFNCEECQHAPELKQAWGCDTPTESAVWEDGENEFYNCPLRFITKEALSWYQEHLYNEHYHTALPYHMQSEGYVKALAYYQTMFNKMNAMKRKTEGSIHGRP